MSRATLMELDPQTAQMVDELGFDRFVLRHVAQRPLGRRRRHRRGDLDGLAEGRDGRRVSYTLTGLTIDWVMQATARRRARPRTARRR